MSYDKEGWQCFVQIRGDKVIKKIKTKKEMSTNIKRYLQFTGQLDKLEEKVDKTNLNTINSLEIIKK